MREEKTTSIKRLLKRLQNPTAPHLQGFSLSVALPVLNNRVKVRQIAKVCKSQKIASHNATALEGITIVHEPTGAVATASPAKLVL